jgi:hypothetical protein
MDRPVTPGEILFVMMGFFFMVFLVGLLSANAEAKHTCRTCGHKDYRHTQIGCVLCRCGQFIASR